MNKNTLHNLLTGLGLTENEAQVYLSSLSMGPTTVLQIARTSDIKRSTVYGVIESLKNKGLISTELRGLKKTFIAQQPNILKKMLEAKRIDLENHLPELEELYNHQTESAFIKLYDGVEAVKSVYEDILSNTRIKEEYLAFGDHDTWFNIDPKFFSKFIDIQRKKMLNGRLLLKDSDDARKLKLLGGYKVKLFPTESDITTDVIITQGKVIIHRHTNSTSAVVVQNKSVLQTHKEIFEIMWSSIPD